MNFCMYATLGQGQEMTLTFNTHISSYIQLDVLVRQRNSIFLKKRAIVSIENVFVYSDRYGHSDLKSD